MAIDFTRYMPPGIYTESVQGPQLGVRSSVPTAVAIFGLTRGYLRGVQSVVINDDVAIPGPPDPDHPDNPVPDVMVGGVNANLNHRGIDVATLEVRNRLSDQAYVLGRDYQVVLVDPGPDTQWGTPDDQQVVIGGSTPPPASPPETSAYTIQRITGSGSQLHVGDVAQVSYNYTDPNYFEVYAFYDYDDVRDRYGEPMDAEGNITSELTLAAWFAFTNGASTVLTCAVKPTGSSQGDSGPTAILLDYENALKKFQDEEQIAIIVPATGIQPIQKSVQEHVRTQSLNRYERRAIIGMDGRVTAIPTGTRIANAAALRDQRIVLVSPSRFEYYSPQTNKTVVVGGQYAAAALAGKSVSDIAAMPLTRKKILGFTGIAETLREGEKNRESDQGLLVVEKSRNGQIQVRHGVTTDNADLIRREWSIIGQQDVMVYRIRDYLDADGLIGQPIYDTTLVQVKASAEAALVSLKRDQIIRNYQGLKVRQVETMPDVIEVRYEWLPAYPLNYIVVRYSVAMLSGDMNVESSAA